MVEPAPLWTAEEIVVATGGALHGDRFDCLGIAIDSREAEEGDLFVALVAERDGHAFVGDARAKGAVAALVSAPAAGPRVEVADTLEALTRLGEAARRRAGGARRAAVTGSVGKTGVTQAVLAGLALAGEAHGSERSFNNHIGVPLTLARMPAATRRAVFEIGMNHPGEIAPLAALVRPHVATITNIEAVHTEHFADGEAGVAREKAAIFSGLEPGGIAILNADSPWFGQTAARATGAGAEVRAFGAAAGATARLVDFRPTPAGAIVEAEVAGQPVAFPIRQSGRHWGPMSLAALLTLQALEVAMPKALEALAVFEPLEGRGAAHPARARDGVFTLIDESYNASPVSVASALSALGMREGGGRRIAVLTDMLELGPDAAARHAALAPAIAEADVDLVFCAGPLMRALHDALDPGRRGAWAPDAAALVPVVARAVRNGDTVLVKGSKASRASDVVAALAAGIAARGAA